MIDASLCWDKNRNGASIGRRSARLRTNGVVLLCALCALPEYAAPAHSEPMVNETSRDLATSRALGEASNRFRLPVHWLRAVMSAESGGDAKSVSSKGAIGLMQLMLATYTELRTRYDLGADPFDSHDDIPAGAAYLRELLDQYGERGFLAAYNAGPGRYEELLRARLLPAETTHYVERIASTVSLGGRSTEPFSASSGNGSSSIFVAITKSDEREYKWPKHNVDTALRAEESTGRTLSFRRSETSDDLPVLHAASDSNASSPAVLQRASDLFAIRWSSGASQ